ncbi:glycoside hydrolase family 19, partial [Bisgaard Taxon 10/6]|nr:glycoside hydrolase family 19 [Exercitatus varius]
MTTKNTQQNKTASSNSKDAWKPVIPATAFPLKAKSNNNKNVLQQYFNNLAGDPSARFLFNESGIWHQGIHLRTKKFKSSEFDNERICAIADGELLAYKVDSTYKTEEKPNTLYSTGFFLLEHHLEYPKGNKLTFYSLYRHTAELKKYGVAVSKIIGETKSADNRPVMIRNEKNQATGKTLPDGVVIEVRKQHTAKTPYDELVWYKDKATNQEVRPEKGSWKIYAESYSVMMEEPLPAIPLLAENGIETQTDIEVALTHPIKVKAGEVLGLMGEYNQIEETGNQLLHLEVFTYDDIRQFQMNAAAAYQQDKRQEKSQRALQDNFLYVKRNSPYYSLMESNPIEAGKTQTEIFVPLSELEKKTVKVKNTQGKDTSKDYYNIQPYLHQTTAKSGAGIYVDDSHLTHGITFPGMNVFT